MSMDSPTEVYQLDVSKVLSFDLEAIVAATDDGHIGFEDTIPWRLEGDLPRFKELTLGHIVIMGRKTFMSIPGGGLSGRINIVVTHGKHELLWTASKEVYAVRSPEEALRAAAHICRQKRDAKFVEPRVFLAGGAQLYNSMLPFCNTLHWTRVKPDAFPGQQYDTWIANFLPTRWDFYTESTESAEVDTHEYITLKRN